MSVRALFLPLALSLILANSLTFSAENPVRSSRRFNLYHRQAVISGSGLDEPHQLPDSLLIEGSERISLHDSTLTRERDYRIDYLRGILRFHFILGVADSVTIQYQVFPFALRTNYFHTVKTIRPDQLREADTSVVSPPPLTGSSALDTGDLRKSGTLVRGITIGSNRDLSVESGLNLQVEGRLGKEVEVLALLSDQNTPLQPEGNTATLQEIDKVLIQVQSSHFATTLGDYELQFSGSRYAGYFRKLQGARLQGRTVDDQLTISGAVTKGQYHSNSFAGQEGNQGPYRLTDREGRAGILVLAGTERVWIDGALMVRGENNDYTIEYGLGEITFMPRRLITSDSRIVVDFQYSAGAYGRDIYAAQGEAQFGEKMGLRATFISESEARNDPLSFMLTDSTRAALAAAGDSSTAAQVYNIDSVAVGEGDYIYADTTWGGQTYTNILVWARPDSDGYLNVVFSYVGAEQGDYARQASTSGFYYYWRGPNQGDYDPVERLPLPQRQRLADAEIWLSPGKSTRFKLEGAVSEFDQNTFSTLDDKDNVGLAWAAEGHWALQTAGARADSTAQAPLELEAQTRRRENRFTQIDRTQQVEYAREWNLEGAASSGESVQEAALTVRPMQMITSKVNYGFLNKEADGFKSERWRGETSLRGAGLPLITAQADWIRSSSEANSRTGFWTRGQSSASYVWGRLTPSLHYEREHKQDTYSDSLAGFLFHVYGAGLSYQAAPLTLSTSQELRQDQKYQQSVMQDFSRSWTQNYVARLQPWRTLTGDALYTHRQKTFVEADSAETRTDLAEINLGWTPLNRFADLLAHYRVNNTRVSSIVQMPIYVGPGQGTYIKSGDLFFEDPDGDYILVSQPTGQFQPVVDLEASFSLDLDPYRLPEEQREKIPGLWKQLASETLLNLSEETKERNVWSIYLLDFSKFQGDSTLHGNILLREDLFLFRHRRELSFRLRGEYSQSSSNLYLSGGQESRKRLLALRVRRAFNERWTAQADLSRDTDLRSYGGAGTTDRDISTWSGALEPTFRPTREWEIGGRMVFQRDYDRHEDLLALRYGTEPRIVRSFTEKGRAELRGEWHHVATQAADLPYEMAEGDPPGDNFRWDLRLDYRLSKYLNASVSYNGSKDAGRETIHVGRAEVRAFF